MAEKDNGSSVKAEAFFERAEQVARTDSFGYAIDMYLEGLRRLPDEVAKGHMKLHELALLRQVRGGKKPSIVERAKRRGGKTALERMINAEYLFAKDPDHLPYAEEILKSAVAGGYENTVRWIADFIFEANNAADRPSLQTYLLLKDSYGAIGQLEKAVAACQRAVNIRPEDGELADECQRLSAEMAVSRGKYDQQGDFRQSIKDRESQDRLHAQASVVKPEDYRILEVKLAREALSQDRDSAKNIFALANALSELETDEADNEAIELLEDAYKAKGDFGYKQLAGQIRIRQLGRAKRAAKGALEVSVGDSQAKLRFSQLASQLNEAELEHYRLCMENYPTDLRFKYEYGIRLVRNERYDEAIPLLQDAQRDPRHRILAMNQTGVCFFKKGWFSDAVDIFTQAIGSHEVKDDSIAKELRYNLGRSYQEQGETEKALQLYRKIAQLDFAYKDVSQRVDKLRNKGS